MNGVASKPDTYLLFDMDSVLLIPGGYHRALHDAVAMIGRALGYAQVDLDQETIDQFEASDANSEWDSSAICAALLLVNAWKREPDLRLAAAALSDPPPPHRLQAPDMRVFARRIGQMDRNLHPMERAERLLFEDHPALSPQHCEAVRAVLHQSRDFRSITHRLFQELILGSHAFNETYGLPALLSVESYLMTYDRPALDAASLARLDAWLTAKEHRAVIFTNRPSTPPDGLFGTPEAEIGARRAGVPSLPIAGVGQFQWLGVQNGAHAEDYLKPSPVHALAALRIAAGEEPTQALRSAFGAAQGGIDRDWATFDGARLFIFEDAAKGLRSGRRAAEILRRHEVAIDLYLMGITESETKREPLLAEGAQVFPNLASALQLALA